MATKKRTQNNTKLTEIYSGWSQVKILKEKNGLLHVTFRIEDDKMILKQLEKKSKKRVIK